MSGTGGVTRPAGALAARIIRGVRPSEWPAEAATMPTILRDAMPRPGLSDAINEWRHSNLPNLFRGFEKVVAARKLGIPHFYGQLWLDVIRADGTVEPYGLASMRVVTDAGVNYIVGVFAGTGSLANLKYHGLGTGTTNEAAADTALVTELTTEYNPDSTRATGTTTTGGSANIYRTVATNSVDSSAAITEHGIFSQAATGGGTLLDRSKFSVLNLVSGDSLQTTYDLTFSSGG